MRLMFEPLDSQLLNSHPGGAGFDKLAAGFRDLHRSKKKFSLSFCWEPAFAGLLMIRAAISHAVASACCDVV